MIPFSTILITVLIASSIYVAVAIFILAGSLAQLYSFMPLSAVLGESTWGASTEFTLVSVPLFIMMGEILLRSGVTRNLYEALDRWLNWLPGGLMHTNIAAAALFAATSGSSVATAATIGTVALPNMKQGYHAPTFLGSIAAGGTLGILIPPSINMVIYGIIAEASIAKLYLAATIPGVLLALLFSLLILVICMVRPEWGGPRRSATWAARFRGLVHLLPVLFLFLVVVGSIYAGLATPTEAAALGVLAALVLAWAGGDLSLPVLFRAFEGTMRTTCMVMLIVVSAMFLSFCMASTGLTKAATDAVTSLHLPPLVMMLAIILFYLVLGCFMEPISMLLTTGPVLIPVVVALGYDPIWYGVLFMILSEAGLITPPIGVNLFVVQSVRGEGEIRDVIVGSLPFLAAMLGMIALLLAFPGLALWLPNNFAPGK